MKILIFLHGTIIMHKTAEHVSIKKRVEQSKRRDDSIFDYGSYIPIGNAVEKIKSRASQKAEIIYLSSHKDIESFQKDNQVLKKYKFPKGKIFFRQNGESYKDIAEMVGPDILIEDNCESIGGKKEMTITYINPKLKKKIKSISVQEFGGIDYLPDNIDNLLVF